MRKYLIYLIFLICSPLWLSSVALGADIYITQSGGGTGASCASAQSVAWFNANAVGGNTYHLCGTFTGTAGSTMLTPPTSGSAGSVVYILFEPNAVLTAPYWGANDAIYINGKNYITVDGGTNGIIQNTLNGSPGTTCPGGSCAYQQASGGVFINQSSNIEIKGLTIQSIYMNGGNVSTATDTGGASTTVLGVLGPVSNILIHNNTLRSGRTGIAVGFTPGTNDNIQIYNNTITDICWGMHVGANTGTPTMTNVSIYGNTITGWLNWQWPSRSYHTDGIIVAQNPGGFIFSPLIYNNYIYGNLGAGSGTGFIFCTYAPLGGTGNATSCVIFNNLLVSTTGVAAIWIGTNQINTRIYNNTIIDPIGYGAWPIQMSATAGTVENNIVQGGAEGMYDDSGGSVTTTLSASNYNVWYGINAGGTATRFVMGLGYIWTAWQALGFDLNSSTANPKLNGSYKISSTSSPAYHRGVNLTSLCSSYAALCYDMAGAPRPATGSWWDMGAYIALPAPPILTAAPH